MSAAPTFPFNPHWNAQDLADAVPLRLFEAAIFIGDSAPACNSARAPASRDWRRRDYLRTAEFPAFVRVR